MIRGINEFVQCILDYKGEIGVEIYEEEYWIVLKDIGVDIKGNMYNKNNMLVLSRNVMMPVTSYDSCKLFKFVMRTLQNTNAAVARALKGYYKEYREKCMLEVSRVTLLCREQASKQDWTLIIGHDGEFYELVAYKNGVIEEKMRGEAGEVSDVAQSMTETLRGQGANVNIVNLTDTTKH